MQQNKVAGPMEDATAKRLQRLQSSRTYAATVHDLSNALSFDNQTVKVLAPHLLPFDKSEVAGIYAPPKSLVRSTKAKRTYNSIPSFGYGPRHSSCKFDYGLQENAFDIKKNLGKLREEPARRPITAASLSAPETERQSTEDSLKTKSKSSSRLSFLAGRSRTRDELTTDNTEWSEYMLTLVSANTAKWIVVKRTKPGEFRNRLVKFLEGHYDISLKRDLQFGEDEYGGVELIYDTPPKDDDDDELVAQLEADRLAKQAEEELAAEVERSKNTDRRALVKLPQVDSSATHKHAKCRQLTNNHRPVVAEEYKTDFLDAMLTNQQPVTPRGNYLDDRSSVIQYGKEKKNTVKYHKNMQNVFPRPATRWKTSKRQDGADEVSNQQRMRVTRGFRRWTDLPTEIDDTAGYLRADPNNTDALQRTPTLQLGKSKTALEEEGAELKKQKTLLDVVEEWRSLWHLSRCFTETTWTQLEAELQNPDKLVKMRAILSCSRAKRVSQYSGSPEHKAENGLLPGRILALLKSFLTSDLVDMQLKRATSICLFTLEYTFEEARQIIFEMLDDTNRIDRHAAALCLAANGVHDARIIAIIIERYLMTKNALERQQSINMLVLLSKHTKLVGGMLAEQLNNVNWRERLLVCDVVPALYGRISRDLIQKLVNLMWLDWHHAVRYSAARALGRTGNGKAVHNDLCDKLALIDATRRQLTDSPQVRSTISANASPCLDADVTTTMQVDALNKLRYLGIMTAKLYSLILPLFDDPHIRIRSSLCALCGTLKISDELVGNKLINLVRYDSSMNVKALAIAALRNIGRVDETLIGTMIWSFRYETDECVRIEACRALIQLELLEREDVRQALLDRHLLEKGKNAKRAIEIAMTRIGLRLDEEIETAVKIREEVQRLCTKPRICALILQNEAQNQRERDSKRLLRNPISSIETQKVMREEHSRRIWEDLKVKIDRLTRKFDHQADDLVEETNQSGDANKDLDEDQSDRISQLGIDHESTLIPSRPLTRQSTTSALDDGTIDDRAPSQSVESTRSDIDDLTRSPYSYGRPSEMTPEASTAEAADDTSPSVPSRSTARVHHTGPPSTKTPMSKKQVSFNEAPSKTEVEYYPSEQQEMQQKQDPAAELWSDADAFISQREGEYTSSSRMEADASDQPARLPTSGRDLLAKLKEKENFIDDQVVRKPTLSISPWILEELLALDSLDELDLSKYSSKDFASVAKLLTRLDLVETEPNVQ